MSWVNADPMHNAKQIILEDKLDCQYGKKDEQSSYTRYLLESVEVFRHHHLRRTEDRFRLTSSTKAMSSPELVFCHYLGCSTVPLSTDMVDCLSHNMYQDIEHTRSYLLHFISCRTLLV